MSELKKLEELLEHRFQNPALLRQALTHSSYINEHGMQKSDCNERLEFLGDAILEMVSSEYLFQNYPEKPEGELSKLRASLVCEHGLFEASKDLDLGSFLIMGKGMELSGGRTSESIVSDAFEAVIAALYLDGGLAPAKKMILSHVLNDIEEKILYYDAKTALQELVQKGGVNAHYELVSEEGPEHKKSFTVRCLVGTEEGALGTGKNKKEAEQRAAYETIKRIRNRNLCI